MACLISKRRSLHLQVLESIKKASAPKKKDKDKAASSKSPPKKKDKDKPGSSISEDDAKRLEKEVSCMHSHNERSVVDSTFNILFYIHARLMTWLKSSSRQLKICARPRKRKLEEAEWRAFWYTYFLHDNFFFHF